MSSSTSLHPIYKSLTREALTRRREILKGSRTESMDRKQIRDWGLERWLS